LPRFNGARGAPPRPAAHIASLVLLTVALHYLVPLAAPEEAWASARIDKRALGPRLGPYVPGLLFLFLKNIKKGRRENHGTNVDFAFFLNRMVDPMANFLNLVFLITLPKMITVT
jgi:hypothetical protein